MKQLCRVILLFGLLLMPISTQAQTVFFQTLYDVPVMNGLSELPEMALSYDKMEGRVASATATYESKDISEVYAFYNKVLPEFGWSRQAEGVYVREGEILTISRDWMDEGWLVTFSLNPTKILK